MPFRWPQTNADIMLAKEVATRRPTSAADWEEIGRLLSQLFSTENKKVVLSGRACRERLVRLLEKYTAEDKKSLKRYTLTVTREMQKD